MCIKSSQNIIFLYSFDWIFVFDRYFLEITPFVDKIKKISYIKLWKTQLIILLKWSFKIMEKVVMQVYVEAVIIRYQHNLFKFIHKLEFWAIGITQYRINLIKTSYFVHIFRITNSIKFKIWYLRVKLIFFYYY